MKSALRDHFVAFCYGLERVADEGIDDDYYSLESTVEEFLARFDRKQLETQIGMIGELLMYLLHPHTHSDLLSAAVYFNKEERNVKKGFDLSFLDATSEAVWYGEVKSGAIHQERSADEKSHALLLHGARDLHDKLTNHQRSRWDAALLDADLTLASKEARSAKKLLASDSISLRKGTKIIRRAFLGSVTFHDHNLSMLTDAGTRSTFRSIDSSKKFDQVRVLSIQQIEMNMITDYIRNDLVVNNAQTS